jgi:hypothetical protein
MIDILSARELCRWAMRCLTQASDRNCTAEELERYLQIRESLLALAENADWLAGKLRQPNLQPAHPAVPTQAWI